METKNKKLLNKKKNQEYYSQSDGNFMTLQQSLHAHHHLDRVAWARDWVHELPSTTHIDVGTKDGYLPLTLTAEGVECVGVDPSQDAIDEAVLKAQEAGLDPTYMVGFGEDLPDGIIAKTVSCLEVIEHVVDPDKLLEKLAKVGSYVMISTPDVNGRHGMADSERNEEHVRLYSQKELEELMSKYGQIVESVKRDDQICVIIKSN